MLTGDVFVSEGLISSDQLKVAEEKRRELGGVDPIARVLVEMGFIDERDRVRCLGKVWGVGYRDIRDFEPEPDVIELITPQVAKRFKSVPLERDGNKLVVAMANPLDIFIIDELRLVTGHEIEPIIAVEEDLNQALTTFYKIDANISDQLAGALKDFDGAIDIRETEDDDMSEDELREMGEDAPIIRLANLTGW